VAGRQKLVWKFKSLDGRTATAFATTQANPDPALGSLANVTNAIAAASSAGLLYVERHPVVNVNADPVAGTYPSIRDRAQLQFRAADNSTGRIVIPAPVSACFLADGETVNFSNGLVDAVVQAVFANLCAPSGSAWVTAVSGKRHRINQP
jgi:hypothetical protein